MKTHRIAAAIAAIVLPLLAADAQAAELKAPCAATSPCVKKLWGRRRGQMAFSSPSQLMEMPHDNPCKRYGSMPRRL